MDEQTMVEARPLWEDGINMSLVAFDAAAVDFCFHPSLLSRVYWLAVALAISCRGSAALFSV
jgi:hypothetical protein